MIKFYEWLRGDYNYNNLIVVDIQKEYEKSFNFHTRDFADFLLKTIQKGKRVLYYYNGKDTVGSEDANDIANWLTCEYLGLEHGLYEWDEDEDEDENEKWEREREEEYERYEQVKSAFVRGCEWYDKGYGFFRDWMDNGVDDKTMIQVIRYMFMNRISSSEDIPEEALDQLGIEHTNGRPDHGTIYLPPFTVDQIRRYNGAFIVGGGANECLKEIRLLMSAFNIKGIAMKKFIFS